MQPLPAFSQRRQCPRRSAARPGDRGFHDAINQAITEMAMTLVNRSRSRPATPSAPITQLCRELFPCGAVPTCPEANLSDWSVANQITNRSRHPRRCFGLVKVLNAGSEVTVNRYP